MHWYDRIRDRKKKQKNKNKKQNKKQKTNKQTNKEQSKFGRFRLGVKVLSFHNFGNLGGQMRTMYDDAFGEKWKGDLYHKRGTW